MVRSLDNLASSQDRNSVAEALLCASRVAHAAIGCYSPSRLAVVDAEVASMSNGAGQADALTAICRTFGLHELSRHPQKEGAGSEGGAIWLATDRCLIGIPRRHADPSPFVALVRPPTPMAFPQWQRDIARIALLYECGRSAWSRAAAGPGAGGGAIGEIMARLSIACALVDAGRNLVYANRAACAWLRAQTVLRVAEGRLCASGGERQRRLSAAVQAATLEEPRRAQAMVFRDEDRDSVVVLTCLPLPGEGQQALVILGDPARNSDLAELLLSAFGLTSAERRLACRLLAGQMLEQASDDLGIRISTARGYLKAIFAKTGVRRQSEFVAVIGALVPPVVLPALPALDPVGG
jgi:DNA-binding CsgD family transcriptional regulator